jgi:hypothetical protein
MIGLMFYIPNREKMPPASLDKEVSAQVGAPYIFRE